VSSSDLIKFFNKKLNFEIIKTDKGGSHLYKLKGIYNGKQCIIPIPQYNKDIGVKLLKWILKEAGMTREEFLEFYDKK
jgi:hypothetical protein